MFFIAKFGRVAPEQAAKNQQEMWRKSRAAYHAIARQLNVGIIPNGSTPFYNCCIVKRDLLIDHKYYVVVKQSNTENRSL